MFPKYTQSHRLSKVTHLMDQLKKPCINSVLSMHYFNKHSCIYWVCIRSLMNHVLLVLSNTFLKKRSAYHLWWQIIKYFKIPNNTTWSSYRSEEEFEHRLVEMKKVIFVIFLNIPFACILKYREMGSIYHRNKIG